jgi:hypothetical protein
VAVAAALVLVAVGAAVVFRPEPAPPLDPLTVTPEDNPVGLAWWLDGTLHLDHGTVRVSGVRHLVTAGDLVVYGDGRGRVVAVGEDGSREDLGTMDVGTPLVSSPRAGLVAWLDPDADDLVVWSADTRGVVGTVGGADETQLVGWDRERLYFRRQGQELSLTTIGGELSEADGPPQTRLGAEGRLADVAAGAELRTANGTIFVVQPTIIASTMVPGTSGQLSPDGRFVLTVGNPGGPAAYDAITGAPLATWFPDDWTPMAAGFTAEGRVVWSVSRVGAYSLIDCLVSRDNMNSFDVGSQPCRPRLDLHGVPVLADSEPGLVPST